MVLCLKFFCCLHPSLYLLVSWAWWDWPLTWLTNHRPSVLWRCWLGNLTRKIVSEMTYNVSSGTLNTTIPYRLSSVHLCIFNLHGAIYIVIFWLHLSLYLLVSWVWWDLPLTLLTNRCPSMLWHCWLGHATHKIVSEMTYNVFSGTLNPTIPYHTISLPHDTAHNYGLCHRTVSVCLSVTFVYSVETNKHVFKNFLLSDSHIILVFWYQMLWQYSNRNPLIWDKKMQFLTNVWLWCQSLLDHRLSSIFQWCGIGYRS